MKLSKLFIENFMCHEVSYVDFSQFSSALIVGKVENNDLFSNGVGKSTIFKAIEYGLFNQADVNLEKIIRDDAQSCKITIDFYCNNQEYRLIRLRTKKNTTDISLFQRNAVEGDDSEVYCQNNMQVTNVKFWKDISGRRAADTEKELFKLVKLNFKSFRSTVHFMQNDFSGLATATPEKRKGILKEALNLSIYSKLEKIAKDQSSQITKDIDRHQTLIESLQDPDQDLKDLNDKLTAIEISLIEKNNIIEPLNSQLNILNVNLTDLISTHSVLESKFIELFNKQKNSLKEKEKLESSIKDYSDKKSNMIRHANEVIEDLKKIKEEQNNLQILDFSNIEKLNEVISSKKDLVSQYNANITNFLSKVSELKKPLEDGDVCKHCRQPISKEYRQNCQSQIDLDIKNCENEILKLKSEINTNNNEIKNLQLEANSLLLSRQKLDKILDKINSKNQELADKKLLHKECVKVLNSLQEDLKNKNEELIELQTQLENSSQEEANKIKNKIDQEKIKINEINQKISSLNKEIAHINNTKAIITHNIEQKKKDLDKKKNLNLNLKSLNNKYLLYPHVLQAFSSTGIPNLFIQNVLDDLQIEANTLLEQLKPGLQLSFLIEKTKSDGSDSDTLDILYYMNGKERQYDQLSGAQKLAVTFSLKLGLSFLLQKMIGTEIKFLLLDEIDQSLDKAGVDAFADIVKFFQKEYAILVITHNDRLKDKFSHAILVEQDINMISRAKVVSSW